MPVTPEEMLRAAEAIHEGSGETARRNAASRAYYAAYHRCRPLAADLDRRAHGSHMRVAEALINRGRHDPMHSIGIMLNQCRLHRNAADYRIDDDFSRNRSATVLGMCRTILRKTSAQRATPTAEP